MGFNVRRWFQRYFYFKVFYDRAMGYLGIPMQLVTWGLTMSVWVKLYGFSNWYLAIAILGFLFIALSIGYFDVKYKVIDDENSFSNKFNPEIQKILRKLEEKEKR